jgi:hypothetical protein
LDIWFVDICLYTELHKTPINNIHSF